MANPTCTLEESWDPNTAFSRLLFGLESYPWRFHVLTNCRSSNPSDTGQSIELAWAKLVCYCDALKHFQLVCIFAIGGFFRLFSTKHRVATGLLFGTCQTWLCKREPFPRVQRPCTAVLGLDDWHRFDGLQMETCVYSAGARSHG